MTRERTLIWPLLAAALAFVVYLPSLRNGYTLDDVAAVEEDARLRELGVAELALQPYLTSVPAARSPYRPVTTLTYALCWRLGGGEALPFHLFNVLAHVAATLLLFAVLTRLGARRAWAAAASALFAVHPVHVEAVANIVGRADVLMTLFCLAAVGLHLSSGVPRWLRIAGVCVAYLLAIGSKENGYVLPLLIVLADALRPPSEVGAESWSQRLVRLVRSWPVHACLAVTLAGYLLVRRSVLGSVFHLDVAAYMAVLPTSLRVTTAVANLTEVARLLLFPNDLSWHYGPAVLEPAGPLEPRFWGGLAVCTAAVWLAYRAMRDGEPGRWTLFGLGWIAASFVLLSNLVLPMPTWLAERTLYLPSVGIALLCVGALSLLARRGIEVGSRRVVGAVALVVVLGGARSWQYARVWESNETLLTDLVERHPESFHAPWWTGQRLVDAGEVERGLVWLERAVELNPNEVMVRLDYARALLLAGRARDAEELVRPIPAGLHPSASVFLAQSLIFQDRLDEARAVVEEGLRHFPDEARLLAQRRQLQDPPVAPPDGNPVGR